MQMSNEGKPSNEGYTIRLATEEDLHGLVAMYLQGFDKSSYRAFPVSGEAILASFENLLKTPSTGLQFIVAENCDELVGFLLIGFFPQGTPLLPGVSMVKEQVWYIEPEHRKTSLSKLMLKALDMISKDLGAAYTIVGYMPSSEEYSEEVFDRYLERNGYQRCEKHFYKEVI